MVLCALLLVAVVCVSMNVIVDPFNAFGDPVFHWDSYTQTLNPRNSKAVYISEHFEDYDSYVIGSSSAASYLPEVLEQYYGGNFYNLFHYGADTAYDRQLVRYLLENDEVKRIVLVLSLSDAYSLSGEEKALTEYPHYLVGGESKTSYKLRFLAASPSYALEKLSSRLKDTEMPQPFDVFLAESGTYDKRLRDVESIGSLQDYLSLHGEEFQPEVPGSALPAIEACAANVAEIRDLCSEAGTELTVILSPFCQQQIQNYDDETLNAFFQALSEVTDYWNFAISPLTYDARYFYDVTHTRNAAIRMVLARIAGDDSVYYPDAFGVYCERGSAVDARSLKDAAENSEFLKTSTATVPILLYHHLDASQPESATNLHPETFERQMRLLKEKGYTPVSFDDLTAFVDRGVPLPENPVMITFDDGYTSNYTYAFPILKELGFKAAIFAIGCSIGHDQYYKDTQFQLTPHFGQEEIDEMLASGLITIGSHTYDMHQWPPFETVSPVRENMLPFSGESEADYMEAVKQDVALQKEAFASFGIPEPTVIAYPRGAYTVLTDVILQSCGYRVTLSTNETRVNTLVAGLPQSLIDLGRMTVMPETTDDQLLAYLNTRGN